MDYMDEKSNLYVFERKEVFLIFVFMILIGITSFILGVKVGKQYSFQKAGFDQVDRETVDLLSKKEEEIHDGARPTEVQLDTKDLREKSVEELTALLDEQQLNQFRLRMAKATGQLGKSHEVALTRKTIARIKTLLTEKQGNGQ